MTAASPEAPSALVADLERAHGQGVGAAAAGLRDAGLGSLRLAGPGVQVLADAAVTSATPFLRAPLRARISAALLLHPHHGDEQGQCPTCGSQAPCPTAKVLTS